MNALFTHYLVIMPECIVLAMLAVILLVAAFNRNAQSLIYFLAQVTLLALVWVTWYAYTLNPNQIFLFNHTVVWDHLALVLKFFCYIVVFFCFLMSRQYNEEHNLAQPEFYILALLSLLGMMVLISGADLLTLYLGLELMSLPVYAMVALQRQKARCIEAAMKYFIIGAVASALLLFGLSLLFGIAGSINVSVIAAALANLPQAHYTLAVMAMIFIVAGVAFKLGAAPFHMWVPDVYDGAPNSVTLFLSTAPKLAAFALLARLFLESLLQLSGQWHEVFAVLAILSIAIGNFSAIAQTSLKRMLAYSSVTHIGYMLLGFAAASSRGFSAALFYMVTYVIMTVAAFGLLVVLSRSGEEITEIKQLAGLNQRNPWLAFLMLMTLFSLAGMPPLVGFIAKVGILEALIQAHQVGLAAIAIVLAIVGAFYYIRVVKVLYFEPATDESAIVCTNEGYVALSITAVSVLVLGIFPGMLFSLCRVIF